jgi:hypothetical protein
MIERVHEHLLAELNTNARTDTIFVITAILLNLITLGVNSGIASSDGNTNQNIIMFTFVALILVVNLVSEIGLIRGRQMRRKLISGLLRCIRTRSRRLL